jgi:hypothetical protein
MCIKIRVKPGAMTNPSQQALKGLNILIFSSFRADIKW